jgi:PKD repeat protein
MKKLFTPLKRKFTVVCILFLFSAIRLQAQCAAGFNFTCNPGGNVSFSNTSVYPPGFVTYTWSFGDNSGSGQTNPSHTYASNGTYTVTLGLTSYTPQYCNSTYTAVVIVTSSPCNMNISASFTGVTGPNGSYSVTSTSTGTTPSASYTCYWGDNTSAAGPVAAHTYSANGYYYPVLVVNDGLCTDTAFGGVYISNANCLLSAGFTYSAGPNGQISFSSTSTGTTLSTVYQWTLGDGGTASGPNFSHTYQSNGTYYVDLYVYNPNGTLNPTCTDNISATVAVNNATCNMTASFTETLTGNTVNVNSTSTGTTIAATYLWNWGDGATGNGPNASHTYTSNGYYPVSLVVNDVCTNTSAVQWVSVNNICPVVSSFTNTSPQNGTVYFMSTCTGTNLSSTYQWSFGDGGTGTGPFPSHQYAVMGTYTVTFTVTNPTMVPLCSSTSTGVITITCALAANFSQTVNPGGVVNFSSTSIGAVPGATLNWYFGDGSTGTGQTCAHTYSNGGIHLVSLAVTDSPTCFDSVSVPVNVNTIPCTANSNFTAVSSGQPLLWYATPSYFGNVVNAVWYWGDGSSTNALYPSHTYSAAGLYNICLSVTVSCAQTSSTCTNYNIYRLQSSAAQMATVQVIQSLATSLKELDQYDAAPVLYPNPNNGSFAIKLKDASHSNENIEITIFDITGKLLISKKQVINENELQLTSDLPNGVYVLKVKLADGSTGVQRLIISR